MLLENRTGYIEPSRAWKWLGSKHQSAKGDVFQRGYSVLVKGELNSCRGKIGVLNEESDVEDGGHYFDDTIHSLN